MTVVKAVVWRERKEERDLLVPIAFSRAYIFPLSLSLHTLATQTSNCLLVTVVKAAVWRKRKEEGDLCVPIAFSRAYIFPLSLPYHTPATQASNY